MKIYEPNVLRGKRRQKARIGKMGKNVDKHAVGLKADGKCLETLSFDSHRMSCR